MDLLSLSELGFHVASIGPLEHNSRATQSARKLNQRGNYPVSIRQSKAKVRLVFRSVQYVVLGLAL
jgi:hypothetical protein